MAEFPDSHASRSRFVDIGVMLEIRDLRYFADGRCVVDTIGSRRFRCLEKSQRDGYATARVEFLTDQTVPPEGMQGQHGVRAESGGRVGVKRSWSGRSEGSGRGRR